ncbi:hypothetical protein U9M48_026723 [Paspalum notatum var. saurae]|uniref:Uncharacterized protein n=1 Tax=Paspalum notatum var. saurae TaxID=547442 RepID=A0AAQ3TV27_PASNO
MGALVAGTKYRGEFEERLMAVLKKAETAAGKVIFFINGIHLVLGAGMTEGSMDAANLFKPMLPRGQLWCIGATTLEEYCKYVEKNTAFERRFQAGGENLMLTEAVGPEQFAEGRLLWAKANWPRPSLSSSSTTRTCLSALTCPCTWSSTCCSPDRNTTWVRRHFRPELLNWLNEIVIFDSVTRGAEEGRSPPNEGHGCRCITLAVTDAAPDIILSLLYNPRSEKNAKNLYNKNNDGPSLSKKIRIPHGAALKQRRGNAVPSFLVITKYVSYK